MPISIAATNNLGFVPPTAPVSNTTELGQKLTQASNTQEIIPTTTPLREKSENSIKVRPHGLIVEQNETQQPQSLANSKASHPSSAGHYDCPWDLAEKVRVLKIKNVLTEKVEALAAAIADQQALAVQLLAAKIAQAALKAQLPTPRGSRVMVTTASLLPLAEKLKMAADTIAKIKAQQLTPEYMLQLQQLHTNFNEKLNQFIEGNNLPPQLPPRKKHGTQPEVETAKPLRV